jgi:PAS domain S-box-containing protein
MAIHLFDLDFTRWEIILLFIIPALVNMGIFFYVSLSLAKNRVNFAFSIFVLLLGLWQAADGCIRMSVHPSEAHEWFRISWVFSLFAIPFAILFVYSVSDNLKKLSQRDIFLTQFLVPVLCLVLIVARMDSYSITESPIWYWISNPETTIVTSFIYLWSFFQALFLLYLLWINYKREKRGEIMNKQALLLAWGFTIPVSGGLIAKTAFPFVFGLEVVPITTSLFTIFSITSLIAIKKYRLLDYSPKNRWSDIVTSMSEGLLILNNEDRIMYANAAFCKLLGYHFIEIENKEFARLFMDKTEEQELFLTALNDSKHHKTNKYEIQLKAKSEEKTWVSIGISPYLDHNGNIIGSIVIQTNINDLKRAEARFRTLIENAGDIIAMTDINGNVLYASPAMEKITGFTLEDMKERQSFLVMHPDEADIPKLVREELMKKPGVPIPRTGCYLHKDGRHIWLEGTVTNLLHVEDIGAIVSNFRDITEKRETERKLEQNQKWFQTLVEYGNDAIAIIDGRNKIQYLSPNNEKILGYSVQELLANNTEDYIGTHPEDREILRQTFLKCLQHPGQTFNFEWRRKHKNGHWVWLEAHATNLIADLNVQGIVVNYRDISERKIIEEQIKRNEKRYRALVENGADAVMILTPGGQPIYVSPSVTRVLGYTEEEAMNVNFFSLLHPDDMGPVTMSMKQVILQPGVPMPGHTARMRHKDGSWRWYESTLVNMISDPYTSGIINNFRDVTDKKLADEKLVRSEKIYKTIASSITGSVIIMFDADYRYLLVEGDMLEKFGYKKDLLLGRLAKDVLTPESFEILNESFKRVFKGEFFTTEISRSGYDIITRYVPLLDENNEVYSILVVSIDVTALKQTQRKLGELNKDLEAKVIERTSQMENANKELESFSYSVSHDLRAPLRAIHGYTQILQTEYADKLDEDGRRMMNRVLINTKKMGQLIDELLTFSRLGKKELAKHQFSMKEMVNSLSNELRSAEPSRDIRIEIDDLPDTEADSSTIKQVWTNLLSNAIKYTKHKTTAIIQVGAEEDENDITYFIKDNGAGFDMEYVSKLFGVFQRLHSDEEFEGIGVGLAIVQRIVVKHGGKIWASAVPDEGATFYFTLPKTKTI